MGTVIAQVLAENGYQVNLWNWEGDHDPLKQIEK
jgi:glycerol-3-phosphate dehydrogenase